MRTINTHLLVSAFTLALRAGRRWPSYERGARLQGRWDGSNGRHPFLLYSHLRFLAGVGYRAGSRHATTA